MKSEFRKLLTVRSTYFMLGLALLIITILGFWVEGYKGLSGSPAATLTDKALEEVFKNSAMMAAAIGGIVAVLYAAHEYRYNMIMNTFTASNSRSKVLLAKILTMVAYTFAFTVICSVFGVAVYFFGLYLRDASLPAQSIDWFNIGGRVLFYNVAQVSIALMIGVLTRSIAAGIVIIFFAPATIEPLIGLLLKENAQYLPFAAMERVISAGGGEAAQLVQGTMSVTRAMMVTLAYLIGGWLITWLLYLRRDAN